MADMMKESIAAIEKKIEDRAEIFEEKTLDLTPKVERMKTVKATIEQSLDSKESELKQKSEELKKLKTQLEDALTTLRLIYSTHTSLKVVFFAFFSSIFPCQDSQAGVESS